MSAADSERPTVNPRKLRIMRIMLTFGAAGAFGCALYSIEYGIFLSDNFMDYLGLAACAGFALLAVAYWVQRQKKSENGLPPGLTLLFAVIWLFGTLAGDGYILGIFDIYTQIFGQAAVRQVTAISWQPQQSARKACAGVDTALGYVCLDRRVAPGTVLILHGRESVFGFHVSTVD